MGLYANGREAKVRAGDLEDFDHDEEAWTKVENTASLPRTKAESGCFFLPGPPTNQEIWVTDHSKAQLLTSQLCLYPLLRWNVFKQPPCACFKSDFALVQHLLKGRHLGKSHQ